MLLLGSTLLLAGCGRGAGPSSGNGAAPAQPTTHPPTAAAVSCSPSPQPPVPSRLTGHRETVGEGTLDPVDPQVQPAASAASAWQAAQFKPSSSGCEVAEVLGYYSAPAPATIDAGCGQPPLGLNDPACSRSTPNYKHRLVWMITWAQNCGLSGGGGSVPSNFSAPPSPPPQNRSCHWFEPIDATTGKYDFAGSSG